MRTDHCNIQEYMMDVKMVLDEQQADNTISITSTLTNQQTSDTLTNQQTHDTRTFNVTTRSMKTFISPAPQEEIATDEQQNERLESDYLATIYKLYSINKNSNNSSTARKKILIQP